MRGRPTSPQILERAIESRNCGQSLSAIAKELGVDRAALGRSLHAFDQRVLDELVQKEKAIKGRQVRRLDWMIEEATLAWVKSTQVAESSTEEIEPIEVRNRDTSAASSPRPSGRDETVLVTKRTVTRKDQYGDPRFLTLIMELQREQRRILGIDKSESVRSESSQPIQVYIPDNGRG